MTKEELKQYIDDNIYENQDGEITGEALNEVLKAIVDDGGTEVEANPAGEATETLGKLKIGETIYTAPQGPQGAPGPANKLIIGTVTDGEQAAASITGEAPNQQLNLVLPKGEQGDPGQNAVNPFKGIYGSDNKPTGTFASGDYIYAPTSASGQTGNTIWKWNGTTWQDSGETPDLANGETFASSETLQQVAIDNSHLVNPVNTADPNKPVLAKAEDVMQLKAKLEGVTTSETKIQLVTSGEGQNVYDGFIDGSTGEYSQSVYNKFIVVPLNGAKSVRWLAKENASNQSKLGWAFGTFSGEIDSTLSTFTALSKGVYSNNPLDNQAVEYVKDAPEGATHAVITIWIYKSGGDSAVTMDNFYCYLQSGESVVDLLENQGRSLNDKINDIPYNLDKEGHDDIDLNIYPNITTATIRYTTNLWDNTKYTYNAFKLIPVSPGRIFEVKAHATLSSQITFLKSDTVEIGTTPDYAGNINIVSAISADTTRRFIVPEDAVYMYVLIQQWDNVYIYRTPQYVRLIQPAYIQQSKIVNNFDSTDNNTVLSGALGPVLKPSVEAGKPINRISPLGGQKVQGANLYYADGAWTLGTGRSCTFVDIQGLGIKKIQVVAGNHTTHFGFVSDFTVPENGVEGLENTYASLIGNIITLNSNTSVDMDVPSEAKFIYFNISGEQQSSGNRQTYIPKEVNILEQESNIEPIIPSWNDNYDYETYVEENYYDEYKNQTYSKQKFYKIDHNAEYKLLLFGLKTYRTSVYGITTYDSSYNIVRTLYPWGGGSQSGIQQDVNMEDLVFQENETYVMLMYYHYLAEGAYGPNALGALMRKLKNDNWVPTNNLIYCVSKIKSPVMPYNYQEADTVFPQTDEWSAWNFVMPYNYNRVLFTNKKFPICTFFHGSSGWDSPDNMGYGSSERIMSASHGKTIIGMLREAGYVVFDINGYGISRAADDNSRHWGNPRAVSTVKKAYEVLVDRFNCRRGMAISGISMAGAIAKSYCMTYPGDVVCAAMEAPSELGGTCRFSVTGGHVENQSQTSAAHAWGYENAMDMYADNEHTAFIGYSPCIAPNVIDENGFIKKIVQTDWNNQLTIFSNLSNFSCNFPVEIKIWHGDADENVPLEYSQWFVNTVRNSNGNATLRLCPNCVHDLNNYPWVRQEIVNYIDSKMKI